jgi:hypothetical protein
VLGVFPVHAFPPLNNIDSHNITEILLEVEVEHP